MKAKTVYDDEFYDGYAHSEVHMSLEQKSILKYEHNLMKLVLDTIANCSDSSTLSGIRDLAKLTLEDLK